MAKKLKFKAVVATAENLKKTTAFKNPPAAHYAREKVFEQLESAGVSDECQATKKGFDTHVKLCDYRYAESDAWAGNNSLPPFQNQCFNAAQDAADNFKSDTKELTMIYAVGENGAYVRAYSDQKNSAELDDLTRYWLGMNGIQCDENNNLYRVDHSGSPILKDGKPEYVTADQYQALMEHKELGFQAFCQGTGLYETVNANKKDFPKAAPAQEVQQQPAQPQPAQQQPAPAAEVDTGPRTR